MTLTLRHDADAEKAVLGRCMIDPAAFDEVAGYLMKEDFYSRAHQEIWQAMSDLSKEGLEIDIVTVLNLLRTEKKLERCGGPVYLDSLCEAGRGCLLRGHSKIIKNEARARKVQQASFAIRELAEDAGLNSDNILDKAEEMILTIRDNDLGSGLVSIGAGIGELYGKCYEQAKAKVKLDGLKTGFEDLDRLTNGLHPSNLIIVGARPSMGKTAFALSIAANVALSDTPGKVAIFSLEMSYEDLLKRLLCLTARVNAQDMLNDRLSQKDWAKLADYTARLTKAPIFIDERAGANVFEIRSKLRRLKKQQGLDLVIIDYLQLIRGLGKAESRVQEISAISRQLKEIAKELKVPIIALSQLSRNVENRQNKRPCLADLRESGAIEQDADLVAFLYRDEYYNRSSPAKNIAEVIIAKHRNGPVGEVKLLFLKRFSGFYNSADAAPSGDLPEDLPLPTKRPKPEPFKSGFGALHDLLDGADIPF